MSDCSLVRYTLISPNKSPRTGKISKITIHHMAGKMTAAGCCSWFARASTQASSNYVIGYDGTIGLSVPEAYRSWCSSNRDNDNVAVTIELSNSSTGGNWPVSDTVIEACVQLCVDICRRNGIAALNYTGDKSGNLTRHDMFCNKVCPGPYLGSKLQYIAAEVNRRLGNPDYRPTIKRGAEGEYVTELQKYLLALGYDLGKYGADGSFGDATEKAVKAFQAAVGLYADGIVGDKTWAALKAAQKKEDSTDGSYLVRVKTQRPVYKEAPQEVGQCNEGIYTIVETVGSYGRLKSDMGWIQLDDTEKV